MRAFKLGTLISGLLLSSAPAFAAPSPKSDPPPKAKPATYAPGQADGAWLWHDAAGEHVRLTVKDGEPARHYTGKICGKGIAAVNAVGTEEGDVVTLATDKSCATFDLKTDQGEDGFDIAFDAKAKGKVKPSDLEVDGKPMAKTMVHMLPKAPEAAH